MITIPCCGGAPIRLADETKLAAVALSDVTTDGTFEGYASLFNREDLGRDIVLPGAFRETLRGREPSGIKMLFQHDPNQPIGVWKRIYEDARGLFVRGHLTAGAAKAREVLSLMRAGAIDGLSIGFRAVKGQRDRRTGIRLLETIDLWEISIVTFPMLPEARVRNVKSGPAAAAPTERRFECWLTQDAGFTQSEAHALMRNGIKGLAALRDARSVQRGGPGLIAQISEAARLLRQS